MKHKVTTNELYELMKVQGDTLKSHGEILRSNSDTLKSHGELLDFMIGQMATKDDLQGLRLDLRQTEHRILDQISDQLGILKGDVIAMLKKGDGKIDELIGVLREKEVLGPREVTQIRALGPFPQG